MKKTTSQAENPSAQATYGSSQLGSNSSIIIAHLLGGVPCQLDYSRFFSQNEAVPESSKVFLRV